MPSIAALIIDDQPVVRRGVGSMIRDAWPDAEIIEATRVDEAADAVGATQLDLLVLDPWRGGDVSKLMKSLSSQFGAPIVVFTGSGSSQQLSASLRAGVRAYLRKDSRPEDLIRALEAARRGEHYVDPSLSSAIVLEESDRTLSARQLEILQMLADGMQTDAVANRLGLSTETVRTHTKRILAKLEASTRTQAVAIGLRHGFIE